MTRAADLAKLIAGGGTITVADNSTNITLKSTDDDANGGPVFDLTRDSASPADSDTMGTIRFRSDDDGGNETQFVDITGFAPDVSDGSEDGQLQIRTIVGGTLRNRLDLASGETVFNEDSVDVDFRVESNGLTNAFMVDGGNNGIGFGHSPRSDLHTSWTQSFFGIEGSIISQVNSGGGIPGISVTQNTYVDSDTGGYAYMTTNEATKLDLKDGVVAFSRAASGTAGNAITFSESMRIDTSGQVGIGTGSVAAKLHVQSASGSITPSVHADELLVENSANSGITIGGGTSSYCSLRFADSGGDSQGQVGYDHSGNHMSFITDDTERMRIKSDGDVTIGTTTDTAKVSILLSTTDREALAITNETSTRPFGQRITLTNDPNDTTSTFLQCKGSTTTRLQISSNGNVTNTNNSYGAVSDLNLKENITDCNSQWDDIKEVKVKKFSYKADKLKEANMIGVIAQDLEASKMNGIVEQNKDKDSGETFKSVKYSVLYMKAIKALQEAMARIETLEAKVATLESK